MKIIFLAGVLLALRAGAQDAVSPDTAKFDSADALAANFRQLSASVAARHKPAVPDEWQVQTPDGEFHIPSDGLAALLEKKPKPDLNGARQWLDLRAEQLEQFDSANRIDTERARASLQEILSRPEFAPEKPPGVMELLRRRIANWIAQLLARAFGKLASNVSVDVIFWVGLIIALSIIVVVFLRRAQREAALRLSGSPVAVPVRSWDEWIAAARAAAQSGDLRAAIQCAYWAGVTRLQANGSLPKDRPQTPREYVRSLATRDGARPFATLANTLERCWYAYIPATEADFTACLRSLEALGCRVD